MINIFKYDHADINQELSVLIFLYAYIISCNINPIDHQRNTSGSMDYLKWEISKCDHVDNNKSLWVRIFLYKYIIPCNMDPIDHDSNTSGSIDHHRC